MESVAKAEKTETGINWQSFLNLIMSRRGKIDFSKTEKIEKEKFQIIVIEIETTHGKLTASGVSLKEAVENFHIALSETAEESKQLVKQLSLF